MYMLYILITYTRMPDPPLYLLYRYCILCRSSAMHKCAVNMSGHTVHTMPDLPVYTFKVRTVNIQRYSSMLESRFVKIDYNTHKNVERDFRGLQLILMDRVWVPGILLKVIFFKFTFSYRFLSLQF